MNQRHVSFSVFLAPARSASLGRFATILARKNSRKCPGCNEAFQGAYAYPELLPVDETRNESSPDNLRGCKTFCSLTEADEIGITGMDPSYIFQGYTITHRWVIILAFAHNYERLRSSFG